MSTSIVEHTPSVPSPVPFPKDSSSGELATQEVVRRSSFPEAEKKLTSPIREVAEELRESGVESLQSAKSAGVGFLAEQKDKIASCIENYTGGLRSASDNLKKEGKTSLAAPAEKTAARLQSTAEYLRNREPADLLHDLEDFARRRPEVVYGALFVAGLATARFLKASAKNSKRHEQTAGRKSEWEKF